MNHTNMRHATKIWLVIWMTLLTPLWAYAQSTVVQGGTGTTSFPGGYLLSGSSALRLTAVPTTTASCTGATSCSAFTVLGSSPVTISTSAGTTYTATFPISIVGSIISFLGLSTSSPGITAGQPLYATGANTIASVASSTFLTSIGGQASGNYLTALTGDVTASGPGSAAATLATVNSNVGSFTNANITVNAKGLVTAAANGTAGGSTFGQTFELDGSNLLTPTTTVGVNVSSQKGYYVGDALVLNASSTRSSIGVGNNALNTSYTGTNNTAVGVTALQSCTSCGSNVAFGKGALSALTSGFNNTAIGNSALSSFAALAGYNVAIGHQAAFSQTAGSDNLIIGNNVNAPSLTGSNQLDIANTIYGTSIFTGSNGVLSSAPVANASIGIGTSSPSAKLSVHANNGDTLTTLFAVASSTSSATSTLFSILNTGNVGIGTTTPGTLLGVNGAAVIAGQVTGQYFTATSTSVASTLPYASTTVLSATGNAYFSTTSIGTNSATNVLNVSTNSAAGDIALFTNTNVTGFSDNVFTNNTGTLKFAIGYGNPSVSSPVNLANVNYLQSISTDLVIEGGTGGTEIARFASGGNVGIASSTPWKKFSVVGTVAINGLSTATAGTVIVCIDTATKELKLGGGATTCAPSTINKKTDIQPFGGGIQELMQIPISTFYFKENEPQQQIGFIAQSLDAIDVRLTQRINGVLSSIRLDNILALTVKAIQDLKIHDDTQDKEIAQLKQEIEQLKKQCTL